MDVLLGKGDRPSIAGGTRREQHPETCTSSPRRWFLGKYCSRVSECGHLRFRSLVRYVLHTADLAYVDANIQHPGMAMNRKRSLGDTTGKEIIEQTVVLYGSLENTP